MKTKNLLELAIISLFMLLLQTFAFGQSSWSNRYTIECNNKNYKFEVINDGSCYVVKFFGDSSIKQDTISSISDRASLKSLLLDIVTKGSKNSNKFSPDSAMWLADKLFEAYQYRQPINTLKSRIESLEHDKGANVGVISIKKATAKVYLISRKDGYKKHFKEQKTVIAKLDSVSPYRNLRDSLVSIRKKKENDTSIIYNKTLLHVNEFEKHIQVEQKTMSFYQQNRFFKNSQSKLIRDSIEVPIDSIDIAFENGVIKDILVRANFIKLSDSLKGAHPLFKDIDTYLGFTNLSYIPIRNGEAIDRNLLKGKNYLACFYSDQYILVIDMADIIYFNRKIPFSSGTYTPKDTTFTLDIRQSKAVRLNKSTVLENLDIRLFTDALGYSGGQNPNGLVQIEAQFNANLSQGRNKNSLFNIWKSRHDVRDTYRRQWVWLNRISPYIKISKIEQNNKFLAIDTVSQKGDLLDIFKYSYFNAGTELNIITFRTDSKQFALNLAGGVLCTKVGNDSLRFGTSNISTLYMNPSIDFQFFESNKIDFNLKFGCYGAWTISALDSVDLANAKARIKEYAYDKTHYWVQFQQSINIHPSGNKQRSIFLRSSQYLNMNKNYFTFQIGYSTTLSSLLNNTK